jgi:LmbE family N-acetylglucosaminyl deacetylase
VTPPAATGRRILFLAPHPDDEVLALGATLAEAARSGARVRVAFLTSGDGFPWAAARRFRLPPGPRTMQRLAAVREDEARAATAALGGEPAFLGFPDRLLAPLWLEGWDGPLRSRYTGRRETPAGLPHTAPALLEALTTLLAAEAPDTVYLPDSLDDHPDHWAAACFAALALVRLPGPAPAARSYLVHRGAWPPRTAGPLAPPAPLAGLPIRWESRTPAPADLSAKATALAEHRTQLAVSGTYLRAFLRPNELCAAWEPARVGEWLPDAVRDRWGRRLVPGADFTHLGAFVDGDSLRLRLRIRGTRVPGARYRLFWTPLEGSAPRTHVCPLPGTLEAAIPRAAAAGGLLLGADAWGLGLQLDRTPIYRIAAG